MARSLHIINPFKSPFGGSELRALRLYEILRPHGDVDLWSYGAPHRDLAGRAPIDVIDLEREIFPTEGVFVIVGAYFQIERIFPKIHPERIVYVFNTPSLKQFLERLELAERHTGVVPDIVYASEIMAGLVGRPGRLEASPIDVKRFHPDRRRRNAGGFVLGRHSRDVPDKHHPDDAAVYREALSSGIAVSLMGATCLRGALAPPLYEAIAPLPSGARAPEDFLAGLDCFYYRTADDWIEAYGRVVLEAMAMGLPVVCCRRVGAARLIADGRNGFTFAETGDAVAAIRRLHGDPALAAAVGREARRTVEALYSEAYERELIDYYLG